MQPRLSNPGIPLLNLLKNPVAIVLISHKRVDNRHIPAMVKRCLFLIHFPLVVKQSIFCAASLVDLNNHDLPIIRFGNESTQILLKQDQTLSHHIKSLFQKLPVIVTDPVTGKGIHALGELVQVDPDLV